MFEVLLQKYNEKKATKEWNKSILGQALAQLTQDYFYGHMERLSSMSEEAKLELIGDFYNKVRSIN